MKLDWSEHGTREKGLFAETQFEASFVSKQLLREDVFKKETSKTIIKTYSYITY